MIVQGFAESYMLGEISSPDLTKFFKVLIAFKHYIWLTHTQSYSF
jgi:hypothetical protein